jgi:hypothetical protein
MPYLGLQEEGGGVSTLCVPLSPPIPLLNFPNFPGGGGVPNYPHVQSERTMQRLYTWKKKILNLSVYDHVCVFHMKFGGIRRAVSR